jgi:hypothetical protein
LRVEAGTEYFQSLSFSDNVTMPPHRKKQVVPGFGDRLQEVIADPLYGSEYQLAKALGDVDRYKGRVSDWASGGSGIDAFNLRLICKATGYSADWLLCGILPKRQHETRKPADVERELAGRLAADIAAALAEEGVHADDVDVDVGRVWEDMVSRLAAELRHSLRSADDARVIECHAVALDSLVKHLGGYYQKPSPSMTPGLWERYKKVLVYAENRSRDVGSFARQLVTKVAGVSVERYWVRRYSETSARVCCETDALRSLRTDEIRGKPYLDALKPNDRNFTRVTRQAVACRRAKKSAPVKKRST